MKLDDSDLQLAAERSEKIITNSPLDRRPTGAAPQCRAVGVHGRCDEA
jgi:hypothetical protein